MNLIWLALMGVLVYFGLTTALVGFVAFLLIEISLDVKRGVLALTDIYAQTVRQSDAVLEIYKLFEQQAKDERDAAEVERIDEQLTRNAGVSETGEVYELPHLTFTWPPKAN